MGVVVVVGSLNIDSVVEVERHPAPGETLLGGDLVKHFGGKGANQAVAAARAGATVRFVGRVGEDADGDAYLARLAAFGIDTTAVARTGGVSTGHAAIAIDASGENTIIVSPGANGRVTTADLVSLDALGSGDVVLCSMEVAAEVVAEAVRRATARGARAVVNLAPYVSVPAEVLDLADPVVVNEHEDSLMRADGLAPRSVLVTRGASGSRWASDEVAATAPAVTVTEVVDTTGAGDTYCGVLAAALAAGSAPAEAMAAASAAAARAVTWPGAQPALPALPA